MAQRRKRRNGHVAQASLETLQEDLALLQANMSKVFAGLGGAASEGVTHAMRSASTTAEDMVEQVESIGQDGVDTLRSTIRSQPLTALAVSVGAGALIGALLTRH
jgi:ElaB/YqjD/DUF883 family membrane-anchored ribosome-binding protein